MMTRAWCRATLALWLAASLASSDMTHLDRLLNRLDSEGSGGETGLTTASPQAPEPPHRVRHNHLRQRLDELPTPVKPDYDEPEDDEDEEENEPALADHVPRAPFTTQLSRPDWKGLSSRKTLGKYYGSLHSTSSIKSSDNDPKAQSEVRSHLSKMYHEFSCRIPQPKIVRVSDHYPDKSGTYYPACTKLHVCAEDTGCCGPTQVCAPKATHKVQLYFYMTVDVPTLGRGSKTMKIEKLTFYNHTECSCQDRTDEMPRDPESTLSSPIQTNNIPDNHIQEKCKCPSEYTVRNLANGSCTCDCFDKQRDCTKYKKGKENFNHHDRLCIEMGKCTLPACDFGVYNRRLGRCPRKHEKFRSWARYKL